MWLGDLSSISLDGGERGEGDLTILFTNLGVITGKMEADSSWRCSLKGTEAAIEVVPKKITIRYWEEKFTLGVENSQRLPSKAVQSLLGR